MALKSVLNYPKRGSWGDKNWRGNTSGYIILDICQSFKPSLFVDVCEGSGTSRDVCNELNIPYVGLDLHNGNDFTKDYVLHSIPHPADVVFSHPPYHDMIHYKNDARDTSRCSNVDEFLEKSQLMLLNQREATADNKFYMTLIGDQRKAGEYRSFQADFIRMMPRNELHNVIIKQQNNMLSNQKSYQGNFIPIEHEYLIIWKKKPLKLWNIAFDMAVEFQNFIATTWRNAIRIVLMKLGTASLSEIYDEVEIVAKHLISKNPNWKAKIRQKLQMHFTNVERGVWTLSA